MLTTIGGTRSLPQEWLHIYLKPTISIPLLSRIDRDSQSRSVDVALENGSHLDDHKCGGFRDNGAEAALFQDGIGMDFLGVSITRGPDA